MRQALLEPTKSVRQKSKDYEELLWDFAPYLELDIDAIHAYVASRTSKPLASVSLADEQVIRRLLGSARIEKGNEQAAALLGVRASPDLVGATLIDVISDGSRRACVESLLGAIDLGVSSTGVALAVGDKVSCRMKIWIRDGDGRASVAFSMPSPDRTSSVGLFADARYKTLFHNLPVSLTLIDGSAIVGMFRRLKRDGVVDLASYLDSHPDVLEQALDLIRVADVNQHAVTQFGANDPKEMLQPVRLFWSDAPDTFRRALITRYDGGSQLIEETRMRTLDGRTIDVLLLLGFPPALDSSGLSLNATLDIGDRLRAERQVQKMQSDLAHAVRISVLGELAATIAHEITQPLTAIGTNAEVALRWLSKDKPNIEQAKVRATRILQDTRRSSEIISRIRRMATKAGPERVKLDLNGLLRDSLLFVRHDLERKCIAVTTSLSPTLPHVFGDPIQLQQVIINLLINGIQALSVKHASRREIHVESRLDSHGNPSITIRDNGLGIEPNAVDRLFEGFFSTKANGMGLGLAISRSIILDHGGTIFAGNHEGGGAQFVFSIPTLPKQDRCSS
ncbi:sensor histidine kinase [Bradyrhizobium erythrophlei]|uniref:sensor histidine kinase n=1 Tax=Bradyrhizobium erythrophlei TaxID=1437360 RepID=UPI0035F0A340